MFNPDEYMRELETPHELKIGGEEYTKHESANLKVQVYEYRYRALNGEIFKVVIDTVELARQKRDEWLMADPTRNAGWLPMMSAPKPCVEILVIDTKGKVYTSHYASDLTGEDQPAFQGWFYKPYPKSDTYYEVIPVGWKPLNTPNIKEKEKELVCQTN